MSLYCEGDVSEIKPSSFALIVGNARSGTTIVGAIADSHPQIICANETRASLNLWRDLDRQTIVDEIIQNGEENHACGRPSEGYEYRIEAEQKKAAGIKVLADKIWNPALLLLHGDFNLIPSLSARLATPVQLVHCVRHPHDVIATMHRRSGAPVEDRMRWYFMHCEAVAALMDRGLQMLTIHHEDLVQDPAASARSLFEALSVSAPTDAHIAAIQAKVLPAAKRTRSALAWPERIISEIRVRSSQYPFLARYADDLGAAPAEAVG